MKCKNCGAEIEEGKNFCENCGTEVVVETKNKVSLKDKIKNISDKTKALIVIVIFYLVVGLIFFLIKRYYCLLVLVLSFIAFVMYLLIKSEKIKFKFKFSKLVALVLSILLLINSFALLAVNNNPKYKWSSVVLSNVIDKPTSNYGEITINSKECLSIYVYDVSEIDYKAYVLSCIEKGFINNSQKSDSSYTANNSDGYQLALFFFKSEEKMALYLQAPNSLETLDWPTTSLASQIDKPDSSIGTIVYSDEISLDVIVGDYSYDKYKAYVQNCIDDGYNLEMNNSQKNFSAINNAGYKLSIDCLSNDRIRVMLSCPSYQTTITVVCQENKFMNKYDLNVYIDDKLVMVVSHGQTASENFDLTVGNHMLRITDSSSETLSYYTSFSIEQATRLNFNVKCNSKELVVTN